MATKRRASDDDDEPRTPPPEPRELPAPQGRCRSSAPSSGQQSAVTQLPHTGPLPRDKDRNAVRSCLCRRLLATCQVVWPATGGQAPVVVAGNSLGGYVSLATAAEQGPEVG
jgi:hypothetical protein